VPAPRRLARLRATHRRTAMKKITPKKLHLAKETLRGLGNDQLRLLAAGGSWYTCTTACSYCTL